ncbi:hypothetical protein ASPZODRAFT_20115 [Penicilliopsis zonata CBS 506.65]|uniref:Uncharacterized protein n=1 Tax=Penicilliopsis zonata CBS 506.65 TaxID=1073090 RepID=A0A1L9S6T3_9EURO|nr:hypothetical protein ASPZODRAFT_20115 [Penicilliopsis zonata CBS 506.65]OJJ42838.1 hypothetical protein ASPZODRAFT_20115 [Penicilliopsis zonata CBS 506.65]
MRLIGSSPLKHEAARRCALPIVSCSVVPSGPSATETAAWRQRMPASQASFQPQCTHGLFLEAWRDDRSVGGEPPREGGGEADFDLRFSSLPRPSDGGPPPPGRYLASASASAGAFCTALSFSLVVFHLQFQFPLRRACLWLKSVFTELPLCCYPKQRPIAPAAIHVLRLLHHHA